MWSRVVIRSLVAVGSTVGIVVYGIKNELYTVRASKAQSYSFHQPSVQWDNNWDKREPELLLKTIEKNNNHEKINNHEKSNHVLKPEEKSENGEETGKKESKPKVTRHIFLIRHGQYSMDGQGDVEKGLSGLGKEQAKLTGKRLAELGFPYTILVRSTMTRATETAEIISCSVPDVPVVNCDMIREGAPIPPEPPVGHWRPEAQQFYEDGARIEAAFRKYFHRADSCQEQDSYEIMVCHSNVIRYFVCRAMQFPPEAWLRFSLHNCSITWLVIHPSGRIVLKALGDSGHIPIDKLTTS